MRKTIIRTVLSVAVLTLPSLADAQNVLRGTVTDRKGVPISGAKVENTNGGEQTTTDMNGMFTLDTEWPVEDVNVYYMGMKNVRKKAQPDMHIKMSNLTWWNEEPDKMQWFVGPTATFTTDKGDPSFGVMLGMVRQWGWYLRATYNGSLSPDVTDNEDGDYWFEGGKPKQSHWAVTVGGMRRLQSPFYLYLGIGFSERKVSWESVSGTSVQYDPDSFSGLTGEVGLMFKVRHFYMNAGVLYTGGDSGVWNGVEYDSKSFTCLNVGLGVAF